VDWKYCYLYDRQTGFLEVSTMTGRFLTGTGMRRAALALAAVSLPLGLVGCGGDDDDDDIVPRNIDFCRLQRPVTIDGMENSVVTVFGRVYIAGLTDPSGGNDPDRAVIGAVGAGPDGSDPATDSGWTWFDGEPNPGYDIGSPDHDSNADEYQADLVLPGPPGDYDYAFRFSGDAGETFTYCDTGLGTVDGYNPDDAGQMTTTLALLFREYVDGSRSTDKAVEIYGASAASVDLGDCEVRIYANGSTAVTSSVALAGTLAPEGLHVACNVAAASTIIAACDTQSANLSFDGNDAVELACDDTTLDVIGEIGVGVGSTNQTLQRDCDVSVGDTDGTDAFDPSEEWTTFLGNYFADLGLDHCS
jgi:hypothetical protein